MGKKKKQLKMEKSIMRIERMLDQQQGLIDLALSGGGAVKPIMVHQSDVIPQGDMFVFADNFQRSEGIRDESEVIAQAHKCLENAGLGPVQRNDVINQFHNAGLVLHWARWTKAINPTQTPAITYVVESALAENFGGNGFTISKDRQTINYLGENYYTEAGWASRNEAEAIAPTASEDLKSEVDQVRAKLAELDAAYLKSKGDLAQAGSTMLLARPLEPSHSVGNLKVSVKDWVGYDQDKSCMWNSCSDSHTDEYGCIGVKKFGKRVVLAESNTNWVTRLVNNYLIMKEAHDKAAIALKEFSSRNIAKDEGVPLTAEQAAQLDSGSGTEDTAGWTCDPCDAEAEKGEAVRKHRKRMEKVNVQRKIKDEPQA